MALFDTIKKAFTTDSKRARQAREQYTKARTSGGDSKIVKAVKEAFTPQTQQDTQPAGSSYDAKSRANNEGIRSSYDKAMRGGSALQRQAMQKGYSFSGGQFSGVAKQAQDIWGNRPRTMVEYAQSAAVRDTTTDARTQQYEANQSIDPKLHDNIVGWGQHTMVDQRTADDWVLSGGTVEEQKIRNKQYQDYMKRSFHKVPVYDPDTHTYSEASQISLDAELPPWIERNQTTLDWWDYYKTYAHDVVQSTADAYTKAHEESLERERNPYRSAFSDGNGAVNSFFDVIVKGFDPNSASMTYENIARGTARYLREYAINPIKAGHPFTAAGNALYNLMETMDFAARGVRAFTAGSKALGGTGHQYVKEDALSGTGNKFLGDDLRMEKHRYYDGRKDSTFEGQDVYWAQLKGHEVYDRNGNVIDVDDDAKNAQRLFMSSGGYALLLRNHPNEASKAVLGSKDMSLSQEELEAKLDKAFEGRDIDWREIYGDIEANYFTDTRAVDDLKQGFSNVKEAYTSTRNEAAFNADTGNMAADIVVETVLDPGLIAGGIAKSATKGAVKQAAEEAVTNGLSAIIRNEDDAMRIVNSPKVKKAIGTFMNSNEGKNIIFKDAEAFSDDVDILIKNIKDDIPLLDMPVENDIFKKHLMHDLLQESTHKNSLIVSSLPDVRRNIDSKLFKTMYALDQGIDAIDSAIVKSSFFVPWAGFKGIKAGFKGVMNTETAARVMVKMQAKKNRAARALISDKTGAIDLTKTADVLRLQEEGAVNEASVRYAMSSLVDQYDDVAFDINSTINKLIKGTITDKEALQEVSDLILANTGGVYKSVDELAGYVNSLACKYAGDISTAYGRVDSAFRRLEDAINYMADGKVDEFKQLQAKEIYKDLDAVKGASPKSIKRSITMDQFDEMLHNIGVNWEFTLEQSVSEAVVTGAAQLDPVSEKLTSFMYYWAQQPEVTYTVQDALKVVDKLERQCHFKMLLKADLPSEASALVAHEMVGEFNALRKQLKKIDVINLRDAKVVTLLHTDRAVLLDEFTHSAQIQNLYGGFYDDVVAPIWKKFKGMTSDELDLMDSTLFDDIDTLARQKYGYDRTTQLVEQIKHLPGFTADQSHSAVTALGSMFNSRNEMGELMLYPGSVQNKLNAALRSQTGESKVGKQGIMDLLQSVDSDTPSALLQPYFKEFDEKPELREIYDKYVFQDALDPKGDVERQMLFTALADPQFIPEMNRLAKEGQALTFHINSTGLNSEINEMTSVAFRKWEPIEVTDENPLTLERLLDAFEKQETVVFQRGMTDDELTNGLSENVLRRLGLKDVTKSGMIEQYKKFYGVTDDRPHMSERELVEQVCEFLRKNSNVKKDGLEFVPPALVAHDMDGFNIKYFTDKARAFRNASASTSSTAYYVDNMSGLVKEKAKNTYKRCADMVGETAYTAEQVETLTRIIEDYVDDINYYATGYRFNDMRTYNDTLKRVVKTIDLKQKAKKSTELEDEFLELYRKNNGSALRTAYETELRNITDLTIEPRGWAFVSQTDDNLVRAAVEANGRNVVNVDTRIYVDDVLSYFNVETEDGFYVNVEDLKKMHDMAKYIRSTRDKQIVSGAEEFLQAYKADYDRVIQSCIDIAHENSWESTQLSYIQNLRIPDNAVDSYLMAKRLYNDHLKYWLNTDELTSLRTSGKDLDAMKIRVLNEGYAKGFDSPTYLFHKNEVFLEACDYVNNHRRRLFDEVTGGGFNVEKSDVPESISGISHDALSLLEGAHEPEIYKWAARSDYEKRVLNYKDGVLRDGIDKATKLTEANSEITSNLRQLRHIDDYYSAVGLSKKQDLLTASTHMKTKQLFDILDESGFLQRESFHDFMAKASELHRLKLQRYRFDHLMIGNVEEMRSKLISELIHNGFNMTVFNSHNYSVKEADELREFVEGLRSSGDDFLSYYEDRTTGNIYIYLNDNCSIAEGGYLLHGDKTEKFDKLIQDVIPHPEFSELKSILDLDDIDDFEGVYHHLLSCWEDTRLLSYGSINGTTGRTVSRAQAEEFMASLPSNMNDWLTSEGLLRHELSRDVVYDPGFVINDESDMLTDFLGTLHRQAEVAKDDCILINEIMNSNDGLKLSDLAQYFTDAEMIEYFDNNPDYVVCTIVGADQTASGFQLRQLNLNNEAALRAAKQLENTAILPYSVYYEVAEHMNQTANEGVTKRLLGKYMLAYKATALARPGTWMRNYLDATLKASLDGGEGAGNIMNLLRYEGKAVEYIGTYGRLLAADPALLNEANWDMIQRTFNTSMTYEEFELLKGVLDSNRFKSADKYFVNKTADARKGYNIISGEDIGLRNLEEKDLSAAYKKFLAKESGLPLDESTFKKFYYKEEVPTEEEYERFEYMFRKLSNNMRHANAGDIFDKTVDTLFKPFSTVESVVRCAQTMYLYDLGFSQNQTLRHIHATQFYNAPSWGMWNKLEAVVPFITFKYNNIMYWIRMMDENPRYFRYFSDLYGPVMDTTIEQALDRGQELDYESDPGLRSGGIPTSSAERYLNVGNSFLSAMNDFYGAPHDFQSLNPLIREAVRGSFYALGLNSNQFFSNVDLDVSDESVGQKLLAAIPGYNLGNGAVSLFKNLDRISTEAGGPTMESIYSTLNFLGVLGVRHYYGRDGKFDFDAYQEELAMQGKWYDANLGRIVDISQKNEFGANNPDNSFDDVQAYMLTHFGKIWDANQHKFVAFEDYRAGGYNDGFDFENDPDAWAKLCQSMSRQGKVWDYNQRKFVLWSQYISGGLNDPNLSWDEKIHLMEEKFPNLKWDSNQGTFVELGDYIAGGLNDTKNFNEVKGLRLAMYGETYNPATHHFEQTAEPSIVLSSALAGSDMRDKYTNYYSMLGIPQLRSTDNPVHITDEGLLMTSDGKYVLTGNEEHDRRVFDKFKGTFSYRGRSYSGYKRHSYNKTSKKFYKPYTENTTYYTGFGWNDVEGYYRLEKEYSFSYRNTGYTSHLNRLISPPKIYPYGGGYGKFSFHNR